jgi:hypothetical protein
MYARCTCGAKFEVAYGSGERLVSWIRAHVKGVNSYCGRIVFEPNPYDHVIPGKEEAKAYKISPLDKE